MKIVVIGGTGLIGSKLVTRLTERGHDAVLGERTLVPADDAPVGDIRFDDWLGQSTWRAASDELRRRK